MSTIKVIPLQCIYGTEVRMTQQECINMLEQYGRLVQEAAAKEVSRYDVTIKADQKVTFKGSTYAQYIERMPLP